MGSNMGETMLQIDQLSMNYGSFRALDRVSLHAAAGEVVVLLGANGAGKSSLFLTCSGILRGASGRIVLDGRDVTSAPAPTLVASGMVHCPEGRKLFPMMTVRQNLLLGAYVHRHDRGQTRSALQDVLAMFPILETKQSEPAGALSGGQQQMVAIGRALMARPKVLLLDEPSLGLAPLVVKQMFDVIKRISQAGVTVVLAEQNAFQALSIAHRGYVMERGRIAVEGSRDDLLSNAEVRRAYIGG